MPTRPDLSLPLVDPQRAPRPNPRRGPPKAPPAGRAAEGPADAPRTLRPGDNDLNTPLAEPEAWQRITEAERQAWEDAERARAEAVFAEALSSAEQQTQGFTLPKPLRRFIGLLLLGGGALAGLFTVSQTLQFVSEVQAIEAPYRWVALGGLGVLLLILLYVGLMLTGSLLRLQRSPRVKLKALQVVAEREALRQQALRHAGRARKQLTGYLRDYPLKERAPRLKAAGLREPTREALVQARESLLRADRPLPSDEWLQEFRRRFQANIDGDARAMVRRQAAKTGLATAALPIGVLDQIVILYAAWRMTTDLLVLYQLRPATGTSVLLMVKSLLAAYLGGQLDAGEESVAELAREHLGDNFWASLTGKVGSKAAAGALNGIVLSRLGHATIRLIQPVA